MALETAKDSLILNQIISQKKDTFMVEDDCIVPDIKPDILNVISNSGMVCIYKKEILDGKIRIDGSINTYIMYLAETEENNVRSLNTNLDFTQIIELEKIKGGMGLDTNISLKSLDCKVLNGRKIHIKAILDVDCKVSSNETVEYVKEIANLGDIQFLNQNFQINSLIGSGSTKIYAKDTLTLDDTSNLIEVMKTDLRIINRDTKTSYNKVLIKADLGVKLIYLTEDNRINIKESTIPIVGFIDLPNISEEHICDVKYEIKNIIVKPNNVEEHSVYVEVEIEVYCEAYENKDLQMIQDLYSPTVALNFTKRQVKVMQKRETASGICNIREKQTIPEIGSKKIYDVEVKPILQEQNILNGRIVYNGDLNLNFIFAGDSNITIDTKEITVPFSFSMDFEKVMPQSHIDTVIEIQMQDFVVMPDESIDIKIDLNFTAISGNDSSISIIDEIVEEETKKNCNYSMIIYFTKPGDTLWKIAKKFNSTVEAISRVNGIENPDNLQVGIQLFIPRYHE
ncbi:MAG: DUF3794 domain-containing protein [Clostridia bacterium]|nr:DUF3794 domain-containing protein [Clostridia bacterium]